MHQKLETLQIPESSRSTDVLGGRHRRRAELAPHPPDGRAEGIRYRVSGFQNLSSGRKLFDSSESRGYGVTDQRRSCLEKCGGVSCGRDQTGGFSQKDAGPHLPKHWKLGIVRPSGIYTPMKHPHPRHAGTARRHGTQARHAGTAHTARTAHTQQARHAQHTHTHTHTDTHRVRDRNAGNERTNET